MICDHECSKYLILRLLEANAQGRCVSFVKEVEGITQVSYLFLTLGSLLLDTKDICGMRAQHMCHPSSLVLVLDRRGILECGWDVSENSIPGLRCSCLLSGWSQLSVGTLEWRIPDPSGKPAMLSQKLRYGILMHPHIRKTSNNRISLLPLKGLFQAHSCCETLLVGAQTLLTYDPPHAL